MIQTGIFPGRYMQGKNAFQRLGPEIGRLADSCFFILDPFVEENLWAELRPGIAEAITVETASFSGECSDQEIERVSDLVRQSGLGAVAGMGGGKTLDTAKAVAHHLGLRTIIAPSLASTDAPTSALSVIYTPEGQFQRYLFLPENPDLVVIDTQVVADAPTRFLVSGMGDALATWFEAKSCRDNYRANMTGDLGPRAAYALAELCHDTLMEYGQLAKISCEAHQVTPALEHVVEANTLLSGLGFESGGLAASHALHNGLTVLEGAHDLMHGEKVSFGLITSLFLTDHPEDAIEEIYEFCETVGLPTTLSRIGLANVDDRELMKAAEAACAEGETIHNEARPVPPEDVVAAMRLADTVGRSRRGEFE